MPQNNEQIKFYFGTQQQYNNLLTKDDNAFYIITDAHKIYLGEQLYANPNEQSSSSQHNDENIDIETIIEQIPLASSSAKGLMSANDKTKLDNLPNSITTYSTATSNADGLMSSSDKIKLDNTGIFCTASEYQAMSERTSGIYFVLNNSTLLIKDAHNNLLTLGNVGNNISLNPTVSFAPLLIYPSTEITVDPSEGTSLESHFEQQEGGE